MNKGESKMNLFEINLIKEKRKKSNIFLSFFIIFVIGWLWIWFKINFSQLINIIGIILTILILTLIVYVFKNKIDTKKDLKHKIKISNNLKIIDKYITGDGTPFRYMIILESKTIRKYIVKENIYNTIKINDFIYIEYSKYANWILKIQHNGVNIENKNIIR